MPAARVTPRVFLSKWWLIRFNKTDAALCRTRHFDKWCSHSSLHQAHSKALSTQVGILLKTSNMHPVPVQNKHKVFCDPYVSESFFLRRDFSNSDFLNPQLGWRRSEECGTGFVLLLPSSAGWIQGYASSTFTQWWYFISFFSASGRCQDSAQSNLW